MGKRCSHFSAVFNPIFFILAGNEGMHKRSEEIGPPTAELGALERLKQIPIDLQ